MCLGKAIFIGTFRRQKNPKPMDPNSAMAKKLMGDRFPELCESTEKYKALLQAYPSENVHCSAICKYEKLEAHQSISS